MRIFSAPGLPRAPSHLRGASQIELLTVLVISCGVFAMAVPSLAGMVRSQRCSSFLSDFIVSLHAARSEAIKRNGRVVLCKSGDGLGCTTQGGWEQGWIVFHDLNNNAMRDPGEDVLRQRAGIADIRFTGNFQVASYVSFGALGRAKAVSGAFQSGTFTLCAPSAWNYLPRRIVLSPVGRPRTDTGTASECA